MNYIDNANYIKNRLEMGEVLSRYGINANKKRIPCPIHNGKDNNFEYKEKSFKCYVCGASGSVIDFVMLLFGINFNGAVSKLNADFNLGLLDEKPTLRQVQAESKRIKEIQAERAKRAADREDYLKELAFFQQLSKASELYAPESEQDGFHPVFVYALHHLGALEWWLDSNIDRLGAGGGRT